MYDQNYKSKNKIIFLCMNINLSYLEQYLLGLQHTNKFNNLVIVVYLHINQIKSYF